MTAGQKIEPRFVRSSYVSVQLMRVTGKSEYVTYYHAIARRMCHEQRLRTLRASRDASLEAAVSKKQYASVMQCAKLSGVEPMRTSVSEKMKQKLHMRARTKYVRTMKEQEHYRGNK